MSKKNEISDDPVLKWAEDIAAQCPHDEHELYHHFLRLTKAYRDLYRRFNRVTRISDSYQKALIETNESLHLAARSDPLTGLSNRRDMMERLTEESARAERYGDPLSMILIDIDHFKSINDEFGHGTGDRVLIDTTYILKNGIRETDTCARWGGEEFLICLPHTRIDDAVKVAEKLRQSVAENTITCEGADVRITISAGVARYKQGYGVDDFISAADDSLYEAKRLGRNRVAKADGTQPP